MKVRNQKGLATWVKVLLGVVVVGFLAIVGLVVAGGFFIADITKKSVDPQYIQQVSQSIAKIDELPQGFKYQMAFDALGASAVTIANPSEQLSIILMKLPPPPGKATAEEVVQEYAERGVPTVSMPQQTDGGATVTSGPLDVKDKGKLAVADKEMAYVIGDARGKKVQGMIGCLLLQDPPRTIILVGQEQGGNPYDFDKTKELLSAIKSF